MKDNNASIVCLSIAGFDPSGGAGIHADLKIFQSFQVYGAAVTTLIAVQNSLGVSHVEILKPSLVKKQIIAVLEDFEVNYIKVGALGSEQTILAINESIEFSGAKIILDPVISSTSGEALLSEKGIETLKNLLMPKCYLICPNLEEASIISQIEIDSDETLKKAAKKINMMGCKNVLITGGHSFRKDDNKCLDTLYSNDKFTYFSSEKIVSKNTHGTGCALSSAITACLAKGSTLAEAIPKAKEFVSLAINKAPNIGKGKGPLNFNPLAKS